MVLCVGMVVLCNCIHAACMLDANQSTVVGLLFKNMEPWGVPPMSKRCDGVSHLCRRLINSLRWHITDHIMNEQAPPDCSGVENDQMQGEGGGEILVSCGALFTQVPARVQLRLLVRCTKPRAQTY